MINHISCHYGVALLLVLNRINQIESFYISVEGGEKKGVSHLIMFAKIMKTCCVHMTCGGQDAKNDSISI